MIDGTEPMTAISNMFTTQFMFISTVVFSYIDIFCSRFFIPHLFTNLWDDSSNCLS